MQTPQSHAFAASVLALHGHGQSGEELSRRAGLEPGPLAWLLPDAPRSADQGGRRSWYDYDGDPKRFADELERASRRLLEIHRPLPEPLGVLGFSQGGYLAGYLGLKLAGRTRALVAVGTRLKWELFEPAMLTRAPAVLVVHGRRDRAVSFERAWQSADRLQDWGLSVERIAYDGGHWPPAEVWSQVRGWLERRLTEPRLSP